MLKYLLLISCVKLTAQLPNSLLGTFNSIGNTIYNNNLLIEYSVGEPITTTTLSINNLQSIISGSIQPQIILSLHVYEKLETISSYSFYPNPTSGNINIGGDLGNNTVIILYDAVGSEIHLPLQNNTLDLSSLKTGIYTLKAYDKNSSLSDILKVIKN